MKTVATQRKMLKAGRRKIINMEKGESEKKKERENYKLLPQEGG